MRLQHAVAVARGVAIAHSAGAVDSAYFDAIALDPSEAAELEFQTNAARATAEVLARLRR